MAPSRPRSPGNPKWIARREERIRNDFSRARDRYPIVFEPEIPNVPFRRLGIASRPVAELYYQLIIGAAIDLGEPKFAGSNKPCYYNRAKREAQVWIFEEVDQWDSMSFNVACQALGLDPEYVRGQLTRGTYIPPKTRRMRVAGARTVIGRKEEEDDG